jgi:hypothetical protein
MEWVPVTALVIFLIGLGFVVREIASRHKK